MVSVTSGTRYLTSASRYQSISAMYIRGLIPWNFAELAEAVPIEVVYVLLANGHSFTDNQNDCSAFFFKT